MFHRPNPINQFYRLDYDEIRKVWVKTTRWNNVVNGHNFDSENCMASEGGVALDAHTQGRIRTSPAGIRNYSGDLSGGIGVDDVQTAWRVHFSQTFLTPDYYDWNDVMYAVRSRRHVAIAVDYRFVPDLYKRQIPGNFEHALGMDEVKPDGQILVFDSLSTVPHWQPQSSVRIAAETLALRERGSKGRLFVGLTAIRPLIVTSPVFRVVVHPQKGLKGYPTYRYFGLYTVKNGVIVKAETRRTGGFSATAEDLGTYPWAGHAKQELVRLTSGFLKGFYVRSGYIVES